jgi:hypothetical protein
VQSSPFTPGDGIGTNKLTTPANELTQSLLTMREKPPAGGRLT